MIDQGVSSFKLFMAYPGVFLVDDGTIFKAMSTAGENGGLVCMHAENGVVIDVMVKRALAEGKTAPKYPRLDPADSRGGRGCSSRDRHRRNGECASVHRPFQLRRRAQARFRTHGTSDCPLLPKPALSICFSTTPTTKAPALKARNT